MLDGGRGRTGGLGEALEMERVVDTKHCWCIKVKVKMRQAYLLEAFTVRILYVFIMLTC